MKITDFLEEMENRSSGAKALFEGEGKTGGQVDASVREELAEKGVKYNWIYQPEGYDLVVMEHDKDGEKPNSWSVAFFTEAEVRDDDEEEKIFDELMIGEAKTTMKMIDQAKGNFLDTVKLAIEIASNKSYKQGFTAAKVKQAAQAAKTKGK